MGVRSMTKYEAFKLRVSLLRIWFMKNLVVFFELAFFAGLILILTGQIDQNTPILGLIFGDLSVAINDALSQNTQTGEFWVDLSTSIITILVSAGILSTNLKRIAISDIKSKSLKKTLVQAGMYFNQDGKLVKRIEEAARMDLNGDGMIGDTGVSINSLPREGFLPGIKRAGEELNTILTMKIETTGDAEKIETKAELTETKKAVELVDVAAKEEANKVVAAKIAESIDAVIQEPGLASKVAAKIFSGVKTSAKATGSFFVGIGTGISNGAVWLTFKFLGLFKRQTKEEKIQKQLEALNKKLSKEEVKVSQKNNSVQPQAPVAQPVVNQSVVNQVLTPQQRAAERLRKMREAQKANK
jgi:hypothetical protein